MDIIISSKYKEQVFTNKNVVTIGTNSGCNFKLDLDFDVVLSIQYDFSLKNYIIRNTFQNPNVLFCSKPLRHLELGSINKIYFKNSDEFLKIRILNSNIKIGA